MLSLLWWVLAIGATYQASRAWGAGGGVGTALGLLVASWILPFGTLLTSGAACYIGYQAENAVDRKQLTG